VKLPFTEKQIVTAWADPGYGERPVVRVLYLDDDKRPRLHSLHEEAYSPGLLALYGLSRAMHYAMLDAVCALSKANAPPPRPARRQRRRPARPPRG
jgi:hypothetical protein